MQKLLFTCFLALLITTDVYAASLPAGDLKQDDANSIDLAPNYIDLSALKLPQDFEGHSFASLQDKLYPMFLRIKAQNKFESREQYKARLDQDWESISSEPLNGPMTLKDRWLFVVNPDFEYDTQRKGFYRSERSYGHGPNYNDPGSIEAFKLSPWWALELERKERQIGKYVARNYFGVDFEIAKNELLIRRIKIKSCNSDDAIRQWPKHDSSGVRFEIFVPASAEYAKSLDGNLRYLLFVKKFLPPRLTVYKYHTEPKLPDNLMSEDLIVFESFVEISALWVFNIKTGEIINKYSSCEIKSKDKEAYKANVNLF